MSSKRRSTNENSQLRNAATHEETKELSNKRSKSGSDSKEDIITRKKKNFVKACELVSQEAYFNYAERLQLIYVPICMDRTSCTHSDVSKLKEMPHYVRNLFKVELNASMWSEALEVCILSITPTQYLSDVVLKDIVEIMLNAHEDLSSGCSISHVIDKCKLVLSLQFSTHCPCINENIRNMYIRFLTSPMDKKEKTVSNRTDYGSNQGIVHFCLKRLDYELSPDSDDKPLCNKYSATPEALKESIKGLYWQNEKFGIFEMLEREDRINRLMAVLHSVIELLQFDVAIWLSNSNSGMKKRQKTLLACILWEGKICSMTDVCKLILKLFCYFVHLKYPDEHIKTMSLWVNTVVELCYITDNKSTIDYPNIGNYCYLLIKEFDSILSDLPPKSILNILERIKPTYFRHQICHRRCMILLSTDEQDTLKMLIDFLENDIAEIEGDLIEHKNLNTKVIRVNKLLKSLSIICNNHIVNSNDNNSIVYPKFCPDTNESKIDQSYKTHLLYITLHAYLDSYRVQSLQVTLQKLNDQLMQDDSVVEAKLSVAPIFEQRSYAVTESFIKTYRLIFAQLKELIEAIHELNKRKDMPVGLNTFINSVNDLLEF